MTIEYPFVVLPADAMHRIAQADASQGIASINYLASDEMYVVAVVGTNDMRVQVDRTGYQRLNAPGALIDGQWIKVDNNVNTAHLDIRRRGLGVSISFAGFKELVPAVKDPGAGQGFLITYDPNVPEQHANLGVKEFAAWLVARDAVTPFEIALEPETLGLAQLDPKWPVDDLLGMRIAVIGVGSVGGAAADALAAYGVGTLDLIDPDRFLWHNIVRHVLGPESVGRYKVDAMAERVAHRWPDTNINPYALDVVHDAHLMRDLFNDVDLIICAADGVAPRRVVSHLARRANKPAVLACVLDDGAIGELIRLTPAPRYGCLLCLRAHLQTTGAIDVEVAQELDYGTGHVHRPMTAVGSDLHLVGQLAAKAAVATLLETQFGDHTQRLPANIATISLRSPGDMAPPFDLNRALQINWSDLPAPRTTCATCGP